MTEEKITIKNMPDLLLIGEVAELLRVSPLTLKRWEKAGKIKSIRVNSRGDRRYKKDHIIAKLKEFGYKFDADASNTN